MISVLAILIIAQYALLVFIIITLFLGIRDFKNCRRTKLFTRFFWINIIVNTCLIALSLLMLYVLALLRAFENGWGGSISKWTSNPLEVTIGVAIILSIIVQIANIILYTKTNFSKKIDSNTDNLSN